LDLLKLPTNVQTLIFFSSPVFDQKKFKAEQIPVASYKIHFKTFCSKKKSFPKIFAFMFFSFHFILNLDDSKFKDFAEQCFDFLKREKKTFFSFQFLSIDGWCQIR
jgi:hypothetical protein